MRILFVFPIILIILHLSCDTKAQELSNNTDYCECRRTGWYSYTPAEPCPVQIPYCCGSVYQQYCCDEFGLRFDLASYCSYNWFNAQWRVIFGMLVSLMVMLCCLGCCYYTCGEDKGCCPRNRPLSFRRRTRNQNSDSVEAATVSYRVEEDEPSSRLPGRTFDPSSPFAFQPPAYETLPKDPPKYGDLCLNMDNPAFESDGNNNRTVTPSSSGNRTSDSDPPPYTPSTTQAAGSEIGQNQNSNTSTLTRCSHSTSSLPVYSETDPFSSTVSNNTSNVQSNNSQNSNTQEQHNNQARDAARVDSSRAENNINTRQNNANAALSPVHI